MVRAALLRAASLGKGGRPWNPLNRFGAAHGPGRESSRRRFRRSRIIFLCDPLEQAAGRGFEAAQLLLLQPVSDRVSEYTAAYFGGRQLRDGWRLPAPELERTVAAAAHQLLGDEPAVATAVEEAGIAADRITSILEEVRVSRRKLDSQAEVSAALASVVHRVELNRDGLRVALVVPRPPITGDQPCPAIIARFIPMRMKRRGVELRLVIEGHSPAVDLILLQALAQARQWFEDLARGRATSLAAIAVRARIDVRHIGRVVRLAFLGPPLIELIAQGRQPPELTLQSLIRRTALPIGWEAQKTLLDLR